MDDGSRRSYANENTPMTASDNLSEQEKIAIRNALLDDSININDAILSLAESQKINVHQAVQLFLYFKRTDPELLAVLELSGD